MTNPENNVEYSASGVVYDDAVRLVRQAPVYGRNLIRQADPIIYVDDGSNGYNLRYTYSYRQYAVPGEKPSVYNNYINNYVENRFHYPSEYESAFAKLHKYAEHDGWHDYSTPIRIH